MDADPDGAGVELTSPSAKTTDGRARAGGASNAEPAFAERRLLSASRSVPAIMTPARQPTAASASSTFGVRCLTVSELRSGMEITAAGRIPASWSWRRCEPSSSAWMRRGCARLSTAKRNTKASASTVKASASSTINVRLRSPTPGPPRTLLGPWVGTLAIVPARTAATKRSQKQRTSTMPSRAAPIRMTRVLFHARCAQRRLISSDRLDRQLPTSSATRGSPPSSCAATSATTPNSSVIGRKNGFRSISPLRENGPIPSTYSILFYELCQY